MVIEKYIRESRRGNQEWTIQRRWQHCVHKTHDEDKQNNKKTQKTKIDEQHRPYQKPRVNPGALEG